MRRRLSSISINIRPSLMFKILEKAKEMEGKGVSIIHLEKGEPEFGTPKEIIDEAKDSMDKGYTVLTPSMGYIELREAIAEYLNETYDLAINGENEVIVVPGAKFGMYAALAAICEQGDEVLCASPFFPPHREAVEIVGGKFVPVPLIHDGNTLELRKRDLEERLTQDTRAILVTYPHNPTGWVPTEEEIKSIVNFSAEHQLMVISDEVYDRLNFDGIRHRTMLSFDSIRENCIYINSFSKTFAMTGWRLGYCVAQEDLVTAMVKIQQNVTTHACSIAQRAGIAAIKKALYFSSNAVDVYEKRRNVLLEELGQIPRIQPIKPRGGFFVFIDISELGISSVEFADQILEDFQIALCPGSAFGVEWDQYVRISMTEDSEKLAMFVDRLKEFVMRF